METYLRHKDKLERMQQSQLLTEMHKKRDILLQDGENQWFQTIKPKNKLIDVSLKKIILKDEEIVRAGGQLRNIKKPKSISEDSEKE